MHFESKLTENIQAWGGMQVALWIVAATCQQGCTEQPHGASCSVVFIVGYLTMYLLYTAFAAGVTSLLAIQGKDIHVQLTDVNRMKADFAVYWDGLIPEMFQV
ncbi:Uncharacterized protein GBIM_18923 [Gryllus bimaculatus]|nr:Uncharacterized protein GBIM_18923 [Gryllus bimaculatus]